MNKSSSWLKKKFELFTQEYDQDELTRIQVAEIHSAG